MPNVFKLYFYPFVPSTLSETDPRQPRAQFALCMTPGDSPGANTPLQLIGPEFRSRNVRHHQEYSQQGSEVPSAKQNPVAGFVTFILMQISGHPRNIIGNLIGDIITDERDFLKLFRRLK